MTVIPEETATIGRLAELEAIDRFLAEKEPRALVLEGPAGIGKTTLWRAGVERATEGGHRVCAARPAAAEASLSLGALRDLLSEAPHEALERLPELQRHAIAVALLQDESGDPAVDAGALGVALVGLLGALADERPLLLAIDDLQWLDKASAATVIYALRRVGDKRVRLLTTVRDEPGAPLPFDLHQVLGRRSLLRMPVGPMSEGAIRRMLRLSLGLSLSRVESHALYSASGGNPFFALELGRAGVELDESGSIRIPTSLKELVAVRLGAQPAPTRETLLAVAALGDPTLPVITRAGLREGLEAAVEAELLELDRGRIRFAHPLLAATVWASSDDENRRRIHRLLAEAVEDPEQRARHFALARDPPDAQVADLLEQAAVRARRRGAPAAAADLLDEAIRFAPPHELALWARLAAGAAAAHAVAGHWDRVQELVGEAQARLPPGPERAAIVVAAIELGPGLGNLVRQAAAEAGETPIRVRAGIGLAVQATLAGRFGEAADAARDAATLARRLDERALLGVALTFVGGDKLLDGRLDGTKEIEEALAIERELGGLPTSVYESPQMWQGAALLWADDPRGARDVLEERLCVAAARGDEMSAFQFRQLLVHAALHAGDTASARAIGQTALEQVESFGYEYGRPVLLGALSLIEAYEGDLERARALGTESLSALTGFGDRLWSDYTLASLVLVELCAGDAAAALAHAEAIAGRFPERECRWSFHQGDELEALVLAGDHEGALARSEALRRAGVELELPRLLAWAERGAGLVHAARGDLAAAQAALEQALSYHERFTYVLERARTLLAYGNVLRRERRRREARAALGEALASFERMGARHFARAARNELSHVGGRPAAGEHELTGAEERIARLVASGLTNKEVGAELFLAVGTVEAALTRIYRKLGLTGRSQLAQALAERDENA